MEIKTKLSIGDTMYVIEKTEYDKPITCVSCNGIGNIRLASGNEHYCPDCLGKGYFENKVTEAWRIFDDRRPDSVFSMYGRPVGEIRAEVTKDGRKKSESIKIMYFPKGMGNYFYEENVFGSVKEAQEECDKRNSALEF